MLIQPQGSLRKENAIVEGLMHHSHEGNHPGLCAFLRALFFSHRILFLGLVTGIPACSTTIGCWKRGWAGRRRACGAARTSSPPRWRPGAVERLQQMGLHILDCFVPQTGTSARHETSHERIAWESFLKVLRRETQLIVNRVERSRRIADFLRKTQCVGRELRARRIEPDRSAGQQAMGGP